MGKIAGTPVFVSGSDAYEEEVGKIVAKIARSQTGKAVLAKINAHGTVFIVPFDKDEFNAYSDEPAMHRYGHIRFSPSTFAAVKSIYGVPIPNLPNTPALYPGMQADEVLLHELVHTGRALGGDSGNDKLDGPMAPYDDEEEFFAILIANIYASEKGKTYNSLRRSHRFEKDSLTAQDAVSENFIYKDRNFELLEKFVRQHPNIAPMIARVSAGFNPIRAYYHAIDLTVYLVSPEPIKVVQKQTQHEARPALTDDGLLRVLKPRFQGNDVVGYGARARQIAHIFQTANRAEAVPLFNRLTKRKPHDPVAQYFHGHLSTPLRTQLLKGLQKTMSKK